jgi:hypothetical protein
VSGVNALVRKPQPVTSQNQPSCWYNIAIRASSGFLPCLPCLQKLEIPHILRILSSTEILPTLKHNGDSSSSIQSPSASPKNQRRRGARSSVRNNSSRPLSRVALSHETLLISGDYRVSAGSSYIRRYHPTSTLEASWRSSKRSR